MPEHGKVDVEAIKVSLSGGPGGPAQWELRRRDGPAHPVTLEVLLSWIEYLRMSGQMHAARSLYERVARLARIAVIWGQQSATKASCA